MAARVVFVLEPAQRVPGFRAPSAFGVRARHRFARRTTFPFAKGYGGRVALRGRGSAFLSLRAVVFPFAAQKDGCPVIFPVIFR